MMFAMLAVAFTASAQKFALVDMLSLIHISEPTRPY